MSGLNQRFTKPSSLYWLREFESHILRKIVFWLQKTYFAQCRIASAPARPDSASAAFRAVHLKECNHDYAVTSAKRSEYLRSVFQGVLKDCDFNKLATV